MDVISTKPATAWEGGRFDARGGPRKLLFGRMYEDSAIELGAFPPGGRVFCIASAGCTALKLALHHEAVAIDINPVQLAYLEDRRMNGVSRRGSAERFMAFARALSPLAGWTPARVGAFLELEDPAEQMDFWRRYLNTKRFRVAFDLLLSGPILRTFYAAAFLDFLAPRFGAVMRGRMERCFRRFPNRTNPYARALLLGEMSDEPPLPEAKNIRLVQADASAFLESEPAGSFDGFTLSNILDGASAAFGERLFAAVKRAAAPGAMMVLRSFREPSAALRINYAAEDRSMLWGIVDVRSAIEL